MNADQLPWKHLGAEKIIAQDLTGDGQGLVTYQPDDFRPPTAKHRAVPTQSAARMLRAALPRTTSAMMALPAPPVPTSAWMELPAPPVPHGLRCVPAKQNDKVEGADTDTSEVFFVWNCLGGLSVRAWRSPMDMDVPIHLYSRVVSPESVRIQPKRRWKKIQKHQLIW